MKKLGRAMKQESIVEHLLMEIQATAMEGHETSLEGQQREMFKRIAKAAFFTQSVKNGLLTKNHEFNRHLLELLGDENLN